MLSRRPVCFEGDDNFAAVAARIDVLLSGSGCRRRSQVGSISWVGKSGPEQKQNTLVKLVSYGPGDIVFGVRSELVAGCERLGGLDWPVPFVVPPHVGTTFCGLRVSTDEASIARVERVLRALGILRAAAENVDYQRKQTQLDQALDDLRV